MAEDLPQLDIGEEGTSRPPSSGPQTSADAKQHVHVEDDGDPRPSISRRNVEAAAQQLSEEVDESSPKASDSETSNVEDDRSSNAEVDDQDVESPIRESNIQLHDQLHQAILDDHIKKVRDLLNEGGAMDMKFNDYDPNEYIFEGQPVLLLAARKGHVDIVREIISRAPDFEETDDDGWTALHVAAYKGHQSVVQVLLDARVDVAAETPSHKTALHYAARGGFDVVVELLLNAGADVDSVDAQKWTALHHSAYSGHLLVVAKLLEAGANVHVVDDDGYQPLHSAAVSSDVPVVEKLLTFKANMNARNFHSQTPLHISVVEERVPISRKLIEMGTDILAEDGDGDTPLFDALGDTSSLDALRPPLQDILTPLLQKHVQIAFRKGGSTRPSANREIVKVTELLQSIYNRETLGSENQLRWLILQWAVLNGFNQVVKQCRLKHEDVKSKENEFQATLLHMAANNGHEQVVKDLLDLCTTPNCRIQAVMEKTKDGKTALELASKRRHRTVCDLLWNLIEKNGVGFENKNADSMLELAAIFETPGQEKTLCKALEDWPQTDVPIQLKYMKWDTSKWTALHWATYHGRAVVVWWLLARGEHSKAKYRRRAKIIIDKIQNELRPIAKNKRKKEEGGKTIKAAGEGTQHTGVPKATVDDERQYRYDQVFKLLRKPPTLQGELLPDLESKPELPSVIGDKRHVCEKSIATIVDFYLEEGGLKFLSQSPTIYEMIYSMGPEEIMRATRNEDTIKLDDLKMDISKRQKHDPKHNDPIGESTHVEGVGSAPGPPRRGSQLGLPTTDKESTGQRESSTTRRDVNAESSEATAEKDPGFPAENDSSNKKESPSATKTDDADGFRFRWLHIPANNMRWVEDLMAVIYHHQDKTNRAYYSLQEFIRPSWTEFSGAEVRSRHMKPRCITKPMCNAGDQTAPASDIEPHVTGREPVPIPGPGKEKPTQTTGDETVVDENNSSKDRVALYIPYLNFSPPRDDIPNRASRSQAPHESPEKNVSRTNRDTQSRANTNTFQGNGSNGGVKSAASDKNGNQSSDDHEDSPKNLDKDLRGQYEENLHISRTLDQYYYSHMKDTDEKDDDQVVQRYLKYKNKEFDKETKNPAENGVECETKKVIRKIATEDRGEGLPKGTNGDRRVQIQILRVDQLWLWIIDEKTIISCSTHRLDDEDDIITASVFEELIERRRNDENPPSSVEEMMKLILVVTTRFIKQQRIQVDRKGDGSWESVLQVFENSIHSVADEEQKLFNNFKDSLDLKDNVENHFTNIHPETGILREVKDILDELNILKKLIYDQKTVWNQTFSKQAQGDVQEMKTVPSPLTNSEFLSHLPNDRELSYVEYELGIMEKAAISARDAINSLLDLKQKQANLSEAVSARTQADSAAKQGNTVMGFTFVTILFLPPSFLTSFFALNITSFPHRGDDVAYPPQFIFPILFGLSTLVIILTAVMAFNISRILKFLQKKESSHLDLPGDEALSPETRPSSSTNTPARNIEINTRKANLVSRLLHKFPPKEDLEMIDDSKV